MVRAATILCALSTSLFAIQENKMPNDFTYIKDLNNITIKTPSLAHRQTAKIELKNGLKAFIVSDPGADQSAAALAVNVGAWNDPDNYEGMAHFTEHLLFLGTKNFPAEDELFQYCGLHNGQVNAYTASDRTVYMFSVQNESFEGGLAIFSDFFKNPLFSKNGVERELNAVDQEHAKNLESDGHRQWMLLKTLGNPAHNNRKFSTGTAETLQRIPHEELVKWFHTHYGANHMYLVIYTKHPIDQAVSWANLYFSPIAQIKTSTPPYAELLSDTLRGHIIYQKPVRDLRNLTLIWDVGPQYVTDIDHQVPDLVAYTLNQKTENSLYEELRREGLIESIQASYSDLGDQNGLFQISCDLTKQGTTAYETVIERCYQALATIQNRSVPTHIYQEMTKMAELRYEYQSRINAFNFVSTYAHQMVDENLSTFPRKQIAPTAFKSEEVRQFATTLTPRKAAIFFTVSPTLVDWTPTAEEKWYGAEYKVVAIEEEKLTSWTTIKTNPALGNPFPNPYIPDHITLVNKTPSSSFPITPTYLENDELGKLYFYSDSFYQVPKVELYLSFKSPVIEDNPKSMAMTDLLSLWYTRHLATMISNGNRAGIQVNLERKNFSLLLSIRGFSEKTNLFTSDFLQQMKTSSLPKEAFELIKDELSSDYQSKTKEIAFFQAQESMSNLLQNGSPTSFDLYQSLQEIQYADFLRFKEEFYQRIYIEGYVGGNLSEGTAKDLWKICHKELSSEPYPPNEHPQKKVLILPDHGGPFAICNGSEMQGNAAIITLQLGHYSYEKRASQLLLARAFQDSFFNVLRTKQQLGYIVRAWPSYIEDELFFFMGAQSASYAPEELVARFEVFSEEYQKNLLTEIDEETFLKIKNSLIIQFSEPPRNLQELSTRYFSYAYEFQGEFDRYLKLIQAIKDLDYPTFLQNAKAFLSRQNTKRVAIQIMGDGKPSPYRYKLSSKDQLRATGDFVTHITQK